MNPTVAHLTARRAAQAANAILTLERRALADDAEAAMLVRYIESLEAQAMPDQAPALTAHAVTLAVQRQVTDLIKERAALRGQNAALVDERNALRLTPDR